MYFDFSGAGNDRLRLIGLRSLSAVVSRSPVDAVFLLDFLLAFDSSGDDGLLLAAHHQLQDSISRSSRARTLIKLLDIHPKFFDRLPCFPLLAVTSVVYQPAAAFRFPFWIRESGRGTGFWERRLLGAAFVG